MLYREKATFFLTQEKKGKVSKLAPAWNAKVLYEVWS